MRRNRWVWKKQDDGTIRKPDDSTHSQRGVAGHEDSKPTLVYENNRNGHRLQTGMGTMMMEMGTRESLAVCMRACRMPMCRMRGMRSAGREVAAQANQEETMLDRQQKSGFQMGSPWTGVVKMGPQQQRIKH